MYGKLSLRVRAVLQALLVTFLWSTSWVFIVVGLQDIPALTFAGLRYSLAALCLLPFVLCSGQLAALRAASTGTWLRLVALGLLYYAVTQGAQFLSLAYLPAATVSLMLSFTTVLVAWLSIGLLRERPTAMQWAGIALYLIGVVVYLVPLSALRGEPVGWLVAGVGVLANALSAILGRHVNRQGDLGPLAVTTVSMGIGAALLLVSGALVQGFPRLTWTSWGIIAWLAIVNSALAFTLWNRALRVLSATESSILNNTMLFQIAVLAWVLLGQPLTGRQIVGMVLAGLGTFVVQMR